MACSSGHASQQLAFTSLLGNNDHFIASNKLYGGSINQFNKTFRNFGLYVSRASGVKYSPPFSYINFHQILQLFYIHNIYYSSKI